MSRLVLATTLCLAAGYGADRFIASMSTFKAHAIIGYADDAYGGISPYAPLAATPGAAGFLSKSVLGRASGSLRDKGMTSGDVSFLDRMATLASAASGSSQTDRLESALSASVTALPGPTPATMTFEASNGLADRAAATATAVAEAFVAEQNETAAALRRTRDASAASRLQSLTDAAEAAHRKLAALGTMASDPAQDQAAAALATVRAKTRLDAFRTVLASGTPPLGAQAGLPSSIAPLQADYMELKRQLLDAQRTLGERHTTVIGLEESLKQAAKILTAEWKRLTQGAETEWMAVRDREASIAKAESTRDPKAKQAIETARDASKTADDAVSRFQASLSAVPAPDRHFRLIAPASVPDVPVGVPGILRIAAAAAAGLFVAGLVLLPAVRKRPSRMSEDQVEMDFDGLDLVDTPDATPQDGSRPLRRAVAEPPFKRTPKREPVTAPMVARKPEPRRPTSRKQDDRSLSLALGDVVDDLVRFEAQPGTLATVFVGSLEPEGGTATVALALARAAAEAGQRVLLVEGARSRSYLAAAVEVKAEPIVVDVLGTLKIAMRDETVDGMLFLAPTFADEKRLAAGLARGGNVPFIDDVAADFDIAIVDGGLVDEKTAEDWSEVADASIRVGRSVSRRDDATFLEAIGGTYANFIGSIMASAAVTRSESKVMQSDVYGPVTFRPTLAFSNPNFNARTPARRITERNDTVAKPQGRRKTNWR